MNLGLQGDGCRAYVRCIATCTSWLDELELFHIPMKLVLKVKLKV